jgi:ferric-dicitrate binding protein FerR (iron transport regulator)
MDPIEDYIINFLTRKESPEDVQKLKEWLASDPAHRDELKQLLATWDTVSMMDAAEKIDTENAYHRFMFRMGAETEQKTEPVTKGRRRNTVFNTILRIAAIFVISFSLGMIFHYYWSDKPETVAFIENITPLGSKSEIKLPDGSMVSLNAGSTLRYPTNYGKTRRDIYLEGEGYFNVAKQDGKPFTVYTPLMNINALGTEFNVKAYSDEDMAEAILIKGKITIENGEAGGAIDRAISLEPGQMLLVAAPELQLKPVIRHLDTNMAEVAVSWKESDWRFEKETLLNLSVKLERRYKVNIHVDDELKDQHFTGTIRDESLEQVLHFMQVSYPITYNINGKDVYIHAATPKK